MPKQRDNGIPIGKAANGGSFSPRCYVPQTPMIMLEQPCNDGDCDAECEKNSCGKLDATQISQSYELLRLRLGLRRNASIPFIAKGFARHAHVIPLQQSAE